MANEKTVTIQINARDGTKQAFQQIANSSNQMGTAIQSASSRSAAAFDVLRQHAALLGSLLGTTLLRGLQDVSEAAQKEEQAQRQLATAVQDAGQNYEQYSAALEKAAASGQQFGLSNTQVMGGLQTLISVTQDTSASINLIGLAEDIAAAKHMDLASAAQLVGRVFDGNVGILKRYGIVVDANATATDALAILQQRYAGQAEANSTTLSRFTAEMDNWQAAVGKALGPFSGLITLLPAMNAGFQLASAGGGLIVDMFRAQSAAAEIATTALQAETAAAGEAAVAGEAAGVAEGGLLSTLAGPVGIVALLGAGAAAIYLLTRNTDDYRSAADAAATDTTKLSAAIATLQSGGGSPTAVASLKAVTDEWIALDAAAAKYREELALANQPLGQSVDPNQPVFTGTNTDAYNAPILAAQQYIATMDKLAAISKADEDSITANLANIFAHPGIDTNEVQTAIDALFASFKAGTIDADGLAKGISDLNANWGDYTVSTATADAATNALNNQVTKLRDLATKDWQDAVWNTLDVKPIQDVINTIFSSFDPSAAGFQTGITNILNAIADGTISAADGYKDIIALGAQFNDILTAEAAAAEAASVSMADMNAVLDQQAIAAGGTADALDKLSKAQQGKQDAALNDRTLGGLIAEKQAAEAAAVALTHLSSLGPARVIDPTSGQGGQSASFALDTIGRATGNVTQKTDLLATAQTHLAASFGQSYDAAIKTAAGYVQASGGLTSYLDALQHSTGDSRVVQVASDLSDVNARLATMTEVVIGNTDAIGKSSQQLDDWATKLIAPVGTLAEIDDLLAKGAISQSTYNAAQEAGTRIFADNARVQQDVQVIQAKEAPLLADLADKQAQYMDQLAQQPAQAQLAALGWMDLGEQQKAQAIIALAASATTSQAAQDIIDSATATDPALEAMLEQLGVIGKDHKVTLKEDGFKEVSDSVDKLTDSMKVLITLLTPEGKITLDSGLAQANVDAINKALGDVPPDTSATVTAYVFGTSDVSELATEIGNLYDRNVYVTTYTNTVDLGRNATPGSMLGGVIQRHASGGVASWLAEAGPEWLDFPNGGHGMAYSKGVYSVPEGTYVHTAPATKAMGAGGGNHITQNFAPIYIVPTSGNMYETLNQSAIDQHRRG